MRCSGGIFDLPSLRSRFTEVDSLSQNPSLWDNRERAGQVLRERAALEAQIANFAGIEEAIGDLGVYLEMAEGGDEDAAAENLAEFRQRFPKVEILEIMAALDEGVPELKERFRAAAR